MVLSISSAKWNAVSSTNRLRERNLAPTLILLTYFTHVHRLKKGKERHEK